MSSENLKIKNAISMTIAFKSVAEIASLSKGMITKFNLNENFPLIFIFTCTIIVLVPHDCLF